MLQRICCAILHLGMVLLGRELVLLVWLLCWCLGELPGMEIERDERVRREEILKRRWRQGRMTGSSLWWCRVLLGTVEFRSDAETSNSFQRKWMILESWSTVSPWCWDYIVRSRFIERRWKILLRRYQRSRDSGVPCFTRYVRSWRRCSVPYLLRHHRPTWISQRALSINK